MIKNLFILVLMKKIVLQIYLIYFNNFSHLLLLCIVPVQIINVYPK